MCSWSCWCFCLVTSPARRLTWVIRPDLTGGKTSVQYAEKHFQPQHRGGGGAEQHQDRAGLGRGWEKCKVWNYCWDRGGWGWIVPSSSTKDQSCYYPPPGSQDLHQFPLLLLLIEVEEQQSLHSSSSSILPSSRTPNQLHREASPPPSN